MQSLKSIGFEEFFARQLVNRGADLELARVAVEHRSAYEVTDGQQRRTVTVSGQLRHRAQSRLELPAAGDWVLLRQGVIVEVLSRKTQLLRQAVGGSSAAQVIAANVDVVFVVTSANLDFNPSRIERYLSAVLGSGTEAVVVLNKGSKRPGRPFRRRRRCAWRLFAPFARSRRSTARFSCERRR